ncbi:MAG: PAN domain-containing protein [Pseudomonadota bacterium]|nr:PAN domain-containing protein [Afipia sp.]
MLPICNFRSCISFCVALVAALALSCLVNIQRADAQASFDRPGNDYLRTPIPSGDPALCALQCERDRRCRAWSFNYPAVSDESAICWLKNAVPTRVPSNCCVSGVRGAGVVEPRNSALEVETDRLGGDYRSVDVAVDPKGETCKAVCDEDQKCRAWTYARPGYVGKSARCFLKDHVKPPRRKPGFISGVVR